MGTLQELLDKTWKSYDEDITNDINDCIERIKSPKMGELFKEDLNAKWKFNYDGELVLTKTTDYLITRPNAKHVITERYVTAIVDELNKFFQLNSSSKYMFSHRYNNRYLIHCVKL
jgi:hypothetical protein